MEITTDAIWNKVKDTEVNFFGTTMPLSEVATRVDLDPTKLFLRTKAPAVIAFIAEVIDGKTFKDGLKFKVENQNKLCVIEVQ